MARKLAQRIEEALQGLESSPAIGSPTPGQELGLDGMRCWRINEFPISLWYFERDTWVDVVRLVGQRQDAESIEV